MEAYVGVTDDEWFRFLAARPDVGEVNFWRPAGGRGFGRIDVGEPFFFKTHHPHNRIVAGGFYSGFARLRISEAWEFFGAANGAESLDDTRARVGKYRRTPIAPAEDPVIGCIFVRDVAFFPSHDAMDPPPDFAPNIVQGKGYDVSDARYRSYFEELLAMLVTPPTGASADLTWHRDGPLFEERLTRRRLGQRSFQAVVLDAYDRQCAIIGEKIRPVLEASHIRPVTEGSEHRLDNGLLLRSDIHALRPRLPQYRPEASAPRQSTASRRVPQRRRSLRTGRRDGRSPRTTRRPSERRVPRMAHGRDLPLQLIRHYP